MAILLIDVGNTAWKYALLESAAEPVQAVQRIAAPTIAERVDLLQQALPQRPQWVAVSSVGHAAALEAIQQAFVVPNGDLRVAVVEQDYDGFHLGYADVSRLGVDRWLAMLAVRQQLTAGSSALMADCGTAVTVEWLSRDEHLGGLIAPGLRLMANALGKETADLPGLELGAVSGRAACWGHSTEDAIASGCYRSVVSLLEQQRQKASAEAELFLTGGDAVLLAEDLPAWQLQQHLVLEGLRLWACQNP